jgi:hypothetical protein
VKKSTFNTKPSNDIIDIERRKVSESTQTQSLQNIGQLRTIKHAHGKGGKKFC